VSKKLPTRCTRWHKQRHALRGISKKRFLHGKTIETIFQSYQKKKKKKKKRTTDMILNTIQGDSGGPLVIQTSPGSPWIQVGIVSWGIGIG
jgi:hypothetical protein